MDPDPPEGDAAVGDGVDASSPTLVGFVPEVTWPSDPDATFRPPDDAEPASGSLSVDPQEVLSTVQHLPRWAEDELLLGQSLGEGGMGVVRVAEQVAIGRDVAVKQLRAEHRSASAQRKLLQEAWAAGSLEHPHIVPVYALARDAEGLPMIVQKRLGGTTWAERLKADLADGPLEGEALDAHLDILEKVTQAVAFAHHRGVVHRDIKPHNVMLGDYGEVALLDWGLAVAVEGGDPRLPQAVAATQPAGTPSYMAPEQLAEDERRCGRGTDVYLLGAVLYEILVGRAPHKGGSVEAILERARANRPDLPPSLDGAARSLLQAAFHDVPEQRPSAEAFLEAVRHHRALAGARRLLAQALDERDDAVEALGRGDVPAALQHTSAARFGLRAAEDAGATVDAATRMAVVAPLARHHLDAGEVASAVLLLDQFGVADGPLRDEAERAAKAVADDAARLRALAGEVDAERGIRTRLFVGFVTVLNWVVLPLVVFVGERLWVPLSYEVLIPCTLLSAALSVAFVWWARDSLSLTIVNRVTAVTLPAATGLIVVALLHGWWTGLSPWRSLALAQTGWVALALASLPVFGRWMALLALAHLVSLAVATVRPDLVWLLIWACDVVFGVAVFYPQRREVRRELRRWLQEPVVGDPIPSLAPPGIEESTTGSEE